MAGTSDSIVEILEDVGGMVSSKLAEALQRELSLSSVAARQRVSRHRGVRRLKGLTFPRNAAFVYLQSKYGSQKFWDALTQALLTHTSGYAHALLALRARGGVMPTEHFLIACGSPQKQKRHTAASSILNRLRKCNLVKCFDVPGVGECVSLSQDAGYDSDVAEMRARLLGERILLGAVRNWARSLNLAAFNHVAIRDEAPTLPRVGTFAWDLSAPSYVVPLITFTDKGAKPGFVACDILLKDEVGEDDLRPFLAKTATLAQLHGIGRTLAIFVAQRYSLEAWQRAKKAYVVPATIGALFGKDVARGLSQLVEFLSDVTHLSGDTKTVDKIFDSLKSIEGADTNLRGALFQYVAAELLRLNVAEIFAMNKRFVLPADDRAQERSAEADIVAVRKNREIWFVECKGYKPTGMLPDTEVDRWLDHTIPILREVVQSHADWKNLRPTFALWTNTRFSDTSLTRLQKAARARKFTVLFRDGARIAELAEECKDTALKRTLSEHFLHHPLAKIDRSASQRMPPLSTSRLTPGDGTVDFENLREVPSDDDGEQVPF